MSYKKSRSIGLATLTTLVGLSALIATASSLRAAQTQAKLLTIPLGTQTTPIDRNVKVNSEYPKLAQTESTSLPSIAELGINLSGAYYQASGNQLIDWNTKNLGAHNFECTEFAYGRAIERGLFQNNQGIATVLTTAAHDWDDRVEKSKYSSQLQTQPRANSIVVWEANQNFSWTEGNGTYTYNTDSVSGHVAFVEKVNPDGSFLISEGSPQLSQPAVRWMKAGTPPATAAKFIYL